MTGEWTGPPLPSAWRAKHALAPAVLKLLAGHLIDLADSEVRSGLELVLRNLMIELGVEHLDMDKIQGSDRVLTQAITRALYGSGAAGILYPSKLDNRPCAALFERRAELIPAGEPRRLTDPLPELEEVCRQFRFSLEAGAS